MDKAQKVILTNMCQISKGDEILVQYKVSKNYSGVTFPGGHIEENEIITDAVIREVFEETGLHIKNPVMRGIYDWINEDGTRYFVFLYSANEFFGELQSSEEGEVKWIKKDSFLHEELAQGMDTVFKIINCEYVSECFYDKLTQEEIIRGEPFMIKAVIFDMYETLITHYESPLYFGKQMAVDAGIDENDFLKLWRETECERSIGRLTLEQALEYVLKENNSYSDEILNNIVDKRIAAKIECFNHLHSEIIPMLEQIRKRGLKIGLISNCFSEEAKVIRNSLLFPYFDAIYLSYEQGIQKPDEEIFNRCMNELSVEANECIYVGDGGSFELEAATKLGMKPLQAVWYLKEGTTQPSYRKNEFIQAKTPMEVINYI